MEHLCIHSDFIICSPRGQEWAGIITSPSKHNALSHSWMRPKQNVQLLPVYKHAFTLLRSTKREISWRKISPGGPLSPCLHPGPDCRLPYQNLKNLFQSRDSTAAHIWNNTSVVNSGHRGCIAKRSKVRVLNFNLCFPHSLSIFLSLCLLLSLSFHLTLSLVVLALWQTGPQRVMIWPGP